MRQIPFDFPGEADHVDRLLTTAAYLIDRGRLSAACDVLELAQGLRLLPDQVDELESLAERGEALARAAEIVVAPHPDDLRGRLLPFRAPAATAPNRSAIAGA